MFLIHYLSLPSVKLFSIVTKTERFQHHHHFIFFFSKNLVPEGTCIKAEVPAHGVLCRALSRS